MTKKSLARLDRDNGQVDHMSDATAYAMNFLTIEKRAMAHAGDSMDGEPITADEIAKTRRLLEAYGGGSVTGRLPRGIPAEEEWRNMERAMKLSKQNFQRLAQMTREIDAAIAASTPLPPGVHEQVMGVIRARLAFVCAEGNPAFDSFRFDAACKGTRE